MNCVSSNFVFFFSSFFGKRTRTKFTEKIILVVASNHFRSPSFDDVFGNYRYRVINYSSLII